MELHCSEIHEPSAAGKTYVMKTKPLIRHLGLGGRRGGWGAQKGGAEAQGQILYVCVCVCVCVCLCERDREREREVLGKNSFVREKKLMIIRMK